MLLESECRIFLVVVAHPTLPSTLESDREEELTTPPLAGSSVEPT